MPLPAFLAPAPLPFRSPSARAALAPRAAPCMKLEIGSRVRVACSVIMYHFPGQQNTPIDIEGYEGVLIRDKSVTKGVPMSATMPYMVHFEEKHPRFKAHLNEQEIELVAPPEEKPQE